MTYIKYYLFTILIGFFLSAQGQDELAICVDWKGGQRFDFIAENFTDIISFQTSIKWDSSYGRIVKFDNFIFDDLNESSFVHSPFHPNGTAVMSWLDQTIDGKTLEDGTVLFSMFMEHKNGGLALPGIDDEPLSYEVLYEGEIVSEQINVSTECISQNFALLTGNISYDLTNDCLVNDGDLAIPEAIVRISTDPDQVQYLATNQFGEYWAWLPIGDYNISHFSSDTPFVACENTQNISIQSINDTFRVDFAIENADACPLLSISAAAPALMHCERNRIYLEYCNHGNQSVDSPRAVLSLDEFLFNVSSNLTFTDIGNNEYLFDLPRIDSFDCNQFFIEVDVSCDAKIGESHCIRAEISPKDACIEESEDWNGASIEVDALCGNATLRFIVRNVGVGDMDEVTRVLIVKNNEEATQHFVQLMAGEEEYFDVIPEEHTYRIIVDQVENHPGNSNPSLGVEGCATDGNSEFLLSYLTQFHEDDEDYFRDILCLENTLEQIFPAKIAQPIGVGEMHLIPPARSLTYTLAVQNTQSDTIRRIIIVDHLSEFLDPLSIRNIVSSHPENLEVEFANDTNLRFVFDNVDLPPVGDDPEGSRLFVSFNIDQADGTRDEIIVNSASVYFDNGNAEELNETFHTVSDGLIDILNSVFSNEEKLRIKLFPNPIESGQPIQLPSHIKIHTVRIYKSDGTLLSNVHPRNNLVDISTLSSGLYFLESSSNSGEVYVSKLIVL